MAIKHGYGTTITWAAGAIAKLTSVGGVSVTTNSIDVTTHDSASRFMEFIAGMNDAGEVALEGLFDPADTDGQVAMFTDMSAGTVREVVITFPSTIATWTFNAFATSYSLGTATTDGALPFSATLKITGVPVLAVTASTGLTTPFFSIDESAVLTPAAANAVYSYVATVLTGVESVKVTPTASAGVITVNGNTVATGEESSAIMLGAAGTNTTVTIVVTETGKAPKTYTIIVARATS